MKSPDLFPAEPTPETREEREERIYREQVAAGRKHGIREGGGNGWTSGEHGALDDSMGGANVHDLLGFPKV